MSDEILNNQLEENPSEGDTVPDELVPKSDLEKVQQALKKRVAEREEQVKKYKSETEQLKRQLEEIASKERQVLEEKERQEAEARQAQLIEQQRFEELLKEKESQAAKAIAEKDRILQELRAKLEQTSQMSQQALVQRDFEVEFVRQNGLTDQSDLLYLVYQKYLRYNYETHKTEVINPATNEAMTNDLGDPYTLTNFIEAVVKPERPSSFRSPERGGSGTPPQVANGVTMSKRPSFEEILQMQPSERLRYLDPM